MKQFEVFGEKILLRDFHFEDATAIFNVMQDFEVVKYLAEIPYPYLMEHAESFIKFSMNEKEKLSSLHLAIVKKVSNKLVGAIGIKDFSIEHKFAEIGYWVGAEFWGNGYASEAILLMKDICFSHLGIRNLKAVVFESNVSSIKVLEKNGFVYRGISDKKYCNSFLKENMLEYSIEIVPREKEVYERI